MNMMKREDEEATIYNKVCKAKYRKTIQVVI